MARGDAGSSALKPRASRIVEAVVLNLRPRPISELRRSSMGEVISSVSSIAEEDSLGGAYDQEKRRWKEASGETRGGEPPPARPKRVEKLGFWENELRRLGGGKGTGPGEDWVSLVGFSFRDIGSDGRRSIDCSDLFVRLRLFERSERRQRAVVDGQGHVVEGVQGV